MLLAQCLLERGREDDARAALERVVRFEPDHAGARYYLGLALARERRYREAVAEFDRVIALEPVGPAGAAGAGARAHRARPRPRPGRRGGVAVAIEGPLKELGLHDVFQLLDLSRKTGVLRITSDLRNNEGTVFFDRGAIVFATGRAKTQRIGERLVHAGKITPAELEHARAVQQREGGGGGSGGSSSRSGRSPRASWSARWSARSRKWSSTSCRGARASSPSPRDRWTPRRPTRWCASPPRRC